MNDLDLHLGAANCAAKTVAAHYISRADRTEITALLRSLEDDVLPMPTHVERIITEALAKERP